MFILSLLLAVVTAKAEMTVLSTHTLPSEIQLNFKEINGLNSNKVNLGKMLFFDKKLSLTGQMSCASCHSPVNGYTINSRVFSNLSLSNKNPPVLFNRMGTTTQGWEGLRKSLEEQVLIPIFAKDEMHATPDDLLNKLQTDPVYKKQFQINYKSDPSLKLVQDSVSQYLRSIFSGDSRYDKQSKVKFVGFNKAERAGKKLFEEKLQCVSCHSGYNFSNEQVMKSCAKTDDATKAKKYIRKYKVPTLRNLASTHHYFHNGRLKTINEAISFYQDCLIVDKSGNPVLPLRAMKISPQESRELIAFLNTLNGKIFLYNPK